MGADRGAGPSPGSALDEDQLRRLERVPHILRAGRPLDDVLTDVAALACDFTRCRYGLVALLEEDGTFGPMGFHGLSTEAAQAIESKPEGHGILAELIKDSATVRIDDIAAHPASEGFPQNHPPMTAFLGVRLDAPEGPLGIVLLGDPLDGAPFTTADERVLEVFAPLAAVAAQNAVLLRNARLGQRWTRAAADFTRGLLAGELDAPLDSLADTALEVAQGDLVAIVLRVGDGQLQVIHSKGLGSESELMGRVIPARDSISGTVVHSGEPVVVPELATDPRTLMTRIGEHELGPAVFLPLRGASRILGAVLLARRRGAVRFTQAEVETAGMFADHATVSFELAAARGLQERFTRLQAEHEVARDLHDHVVQRLFATGLSFQQALPGIEGRAKEKIEAGMSALEETVQEIRDKILSLRHDG